MNRKWTTYIESNPFWSIFLLDTQFKNHWTYCNKPNYSFSKATEKTEPNPSWKNTSMRNQLFTKNAQPNEKSLFILLLRKSLLKFNLVVAIDSVINFKIDDNSQAPFFGAPIIPTPGVLMKIITEDIKRTTSTRHCTTILIPTATHSFFDHGARISEKLSALAHNPVQTLQKKNISFKATLFVLFPDIDTLD